MNHLITGKPLNDNAEPGVKNEFWWERVLYGGLILIVFLSICFDMVNQM